MRSPKCSATETAARLSLLAKRKTAPTGGLPVRRQGQDQEAFFWSCSCFRPFPLASYVHLR